MNSLVSMNDNTTNRSNLKDNNLSNTNTNTKSLTLPNKREYKLVAPPEGIITLEEKERPICDIYRQNSMAYDKPIMVLRGTVEVTKIKAKLNEDSGKVWDESYHNVSNVQVTRPAHDSWGIKKIVFTFCDDFMQRVFDLPWAVDETWSTLLSPIYEAIGVRKHQVIRALFASMPTGSIIPVHHDTGYWVKHSHRIHVPIDTGADVDFLIGCISDKLNKVMISEGDIVELNNQCEHAVMNYMNVPRIHFIFDYVEESYFSDHTLPRYRLSPGAIVKQTRRSIDLAEEYGKRPIPSYTVLGAQKSGTTSLYELISQHSLSLKGKVRESHYLDWFWDQRIKASIDVLSSDNLFAEPCEAIKTYYDKHYKNYLTLYDKEKLLEHPSLFTGESCPSYLIHSDVVIPRIRRMMPWVKLLVILRNPVDRAYSHYNMSIDMTGTPAQLKARGQSQYIGKTFEDIIETEISELNALGIKPESSYEEVKEMYLVSLPMGHGGHSLVYRGMYYLQILPYLQHFSLNENLMILSLDDIKGDASQVQKTMDKVFNFIGVPSDEVLDSEPKNTRSYNKLNDQTRKKLQKFYEPYNKKLEEILQKNFGWS